MANYVKFKQGLKKDFNTTNQPLTNGMIYFVIDENNHGSIYYDTIVDGKKATKNGTVHRVKFSGLPIKITGSVIGTGVISQDGETIEINTSTNHSHGLVHQDFTVTLSDDNTNLKWTRLGNQNRGGFWLKSIRGQAKAPAWFLPDFSAGIAFGGADTKGIISVKYRQPGVRFAGGNGDAPVWYFTITGSNDKTYNLNGIGGHSSDSAKLDHNVTFKITSTADATKGGSGTATNLSASAVDLYLPTKISGFNLLQATRFQGNADTSTVAAKLGRSGNTSLPMTFNWSGQGGQPTWLWGGENGTDMYVYNPSNFRVAHSVNTAGLDHNITFKISKVADATIGETGITTNLTENAVTFTIPSDLSGFNNIQSTRFQGTADNADTVDYFHVAEEKYKYETTKTQPTSGADWCIKISTPDWNSWSETIYLTASGNNTNGTVILKTGSRQNNWWGYATSYNGTGIIGVYKLVSNSDDVYIKVNGAYTSVRIRTTFNPTISIPATIPDYKFTSVPYQGGFFSNAIYTDNLTFTTPKYWANVPISDNSKTDTQPTFNTAYVSNWWRSTGNTGWWNETHRGGVTMEDDTYVKVAGNKSFLIPNGSLKIGGNGNIFFATGNDDATLKVYGQTNTKFGTETIAIQTCFDNQDPQTSGYTTQYANRCNLLLQPRGGQVYIGKNLTTIGDTGYKLLVAGNQWTSGSQWINGNLLFTDITGNITDTGMSLKGVYGYIGGNDGWRIAGGARETNAGYLEIATCDDMNEPIYVRQYGGGGSWNGDVSLARTFTLLDAAGRSRAPELFEAKKVHVNSLSDQSVAIADIGYQFQVTGTSNFTDSVDISGVTTHHNNIQIDANYSIAKPGKSSAWYGSHTNAMIRMTSINGWSPLLAQKATDGYWVLGHYTEGDFKNQWLFGYLADSNLEGTTGASNSLTTTYRLLNIGGNDNQRMFVSAKYNAAVGSGTQPVYIQNNGNVATCSYSLSATIEAGTANRMAYYKAANQIGSSDHYVTSSQVGINSNTTHDFTFYVGGNSYFSNLVTVYAGNNLGVKIGQTNITARDGSLIFQNNTALRFGSSEWDWNKWAGLKYVPSSKTIVMGLADSTNFTANSAQSGGTFLFTGMSSIDLNKTASIKNLAVGGGIYWNPYVESAGDGSDAASITVIAGGVAGGTELRIQQQNDENDVINLVVNNSIFLNSKRAFALYNDWLRINEDSSFGGGIYTGSSLIRSDNQLQVGNKGANFYANSSGNGYFSNTLGIAGTNNSYRLYVNGNSLHTNTININPNTVAIDFRYNDDRLHSTISYQTSGNEALVFANKYAYTSFLFITNEDSITNHGSDRWKSLTSAGLQIKENSVQIGGLWGNDVHPDYKLKVNGTSYFTDFIRIPFNKSLIQDQHSDSNYTIFIEWRKGGGAGQSDFTYNPHVGQHNTGGANGSGSICVLPYATSTNPWSGSVGLFITKNKLMLDNCRVPTTGNTSGNIGFASQPVYVNNGVITAITGSIANDTTGKAAGLSCYFIDNNLTVAQAKDQIRSKLTNKGIAAAVLSSSYINQWNTNTASYYNSSVHSVIALNPGYDNTTYGHFLVAHYGDRDLCHIGVDGGHWGSLRTLLDNVNYRGILDGSYVKKSGDTMTGTLSNSTVKGGMWITGTHECTFFSKNATTASAGSYYQGHYGLKTPSGAWSLGILSGSDDLYFVYGTDANYTARTNTSNTNVRISSNGGIYGAVWNDYAEFRRSKQKDIKPGHVVIETGRGDLVLSSKRMQPGGNIVSDTYGFAIGEAKDCKTPIAVSGRVLAYPYEDRDSYQAGDPVCSGPNGTISKMTREEVREYPDRIIGTVSEIPDYEVWGTGNVKVNNRIWIKVK